MKKTASSIFLFIIFFITGHAQCTADAGQDKFICSGSSSTIGPASSDPNTSYYWSPSTGLNNAYVYNPTTTTTTTRTYTLYASGKNLLTYGDFENGLSGFETDFPQYPNYLDSYNCGYYRVVASSSESLTTCTTYPYSGSGMLIANSKGSGGESYRILYKTFTVVPNTNYVFKGFYSQVNQSDPLHINVNIIGNSTGTTNYALDDTVSCNQWIQFSYPWNSGSNASVTIELRFKGLPWTNCQSILGLDNLYFGIDCAESSDQVTVNVASGSPAVTPVGPITYYYWYEGSVQIPLTANKAGQWYKNNVAISGATGTTYNASYSGNGIPTDTYKCVNACGTSNVVTVNAIGCTTTSQYPVTIPPQVNCASTAANGWTLSQVNKGTNATYLWDLPNAVYWQVYDPFARTTFFNLSDVNAPWPATQYVHTRAVAALGSETRMSFGVGITNYSCRPFPPSMSLQPEPEETLFYPNPAKNEITIKGNSPINSISIIDATGRRVKTISPVNTNKLLVNISDLNKGVYYVEITSLKEKKSIRLLISR